MVTELQRAFEQLKRLALHQDPPTVADTNGGLPVSKRTLAWTDKLTALVLVRFAVWMAITAFVYRGITSYAWKLAEWMDDHQFYAWEESDRMTLLRWGQLPAWNPYWCGGTVGIGAPEDPFLGPDFLLRLVFGVAHGRRLAILLLVVMGMEGMYRLCRRLDASVVASGFAAVVFATCDRYVAFIHDGWVNFLGFELIPWVAFCFLSGLQSWRYRLLGGFFFGWIVLSAGTYPAPFALLALAYLTVAFCLLGLCRREPGAWLTPIVSASTIGVVGFFVSCGKLIPTLAFVRQFLICNQIRLIVDLARIPAARLFQRGVKPPGSIVPLDAEKIVEFSTHALTCFCIHVSISLRHQTETLWDRRRC